MLNGLTVSRKILIASALFVIPIAALLYDLVTTQPVGIETTQKELAGSTYFRAIVRTQHALYQYRQGVTTAAPDLDRLRDGLNSEIANLEKTEAEMGESMQSADSANAAIGSLKNYIANKSPTASANAAIGTLRDLMARIGDQSGLVLDPSWTAIT